MKFNKVASALVLVLGMASVGAQAAYDNQGQGKVNFVGAIVDAACSISPDTVNQTVELGQVAAHVLEDGGQSTKAPFQIKLENCALAKASDTTRAATAKQVSITFTGTSDTKAPEMLALEGANGAGVVIVNNEDKPVKLGVAESAQDLVEGTNLLKFGAFLKGDGADIRTGDFTSVANFTLSYE